MDVTSLLAPLLTKLWFVFPLLLLAAIVKSPWFKGMVGEWFLNLCLGLFLDKREYHLLKDVTLPISQGTTQIDHVIVSRFGLFVIETKNMKGWIFGNPAHKSWTQQIYRRRHHFQNPLHQNHLHVMTLKALLGLADQQLHSVIYFIGDCTEPWIDPIYQGEDHTGIDPCRHHPGGQDHPANTIDSQLADPQTTCCTTKGAPPGALTKITLCYPSG